MEDAFVAALAIAFLLDSLRQFGAWVWCVFVCVNYWVCQRWRNERIEKSGITHRGMSSTSSAQPCLN